MNYKNIKRICIVDSSYTLLLYLLISNKEEIESTFYFWGNGIPSQVKDYFKSRSYTFNTKKIKTKFDKIIFCFCLYHFKAKLKWPFLRNKDLTYWGHDHLLFSSGILGKNQIKVIEDGASNYYSRNFKNNTNKFSRLKKIIFGRAYCQKNYMGEGEHCNKIYLTALKDTSIMKSPKVEQISIQHLWDKSNSNKQKLIKEIYDITEDDIMILKKKNSLLLTQTFSEDNIITEFEKINLYKDIIQNININDLIIKPHPREITSYDIFFPSITVFQKKIPIQLLTLCGIKFEKVYTICSTAAYDFPKETDIIYLGSQIHPLINQRYPDLVK